MEDGMKGKSILITGGTGSFGNAFVDRLLTLDPKRVVIYSRDEHKQEQMARRLGAWGIDHPTLRFFIGDVRSPSRLEMAMHGIDIVVHAAAMKIVPTAEYNPTECVATNIGGAENVIRASIRAGVSKVLALSTDKAVNPVNLYGATKLAAEKVFIAANALSAGSCAFSVMRYGNVVGSNGSVVPVFRRLLASGSPLTVTDPKMTRFWITLPQAVAWALFCLDDMVGREIIVPKMPSIKIMDLILAMDGRDEGDCKIIGIRPGEKLHETLISQEEGCIAEEHEDFFRLHPTGTPVGGIGAAYTSEANTHWLTVEQIKETIK